LAVFVIIIVTVNINHTGTETGDSWVQSLRILPSYPGQLSLAIPLWVRKMSSNLYS